MTEGSSTHYFRMKFESRRRVSKISQPRHLAKLLREFGTRKAKPILTPMDPGTEVVHEEPGQAFVNKYQSAVDVYSHGN